MMTEEIDAQPVANVNSANPLPEQSNEPSLLEIVVVSKGL